MNEQLEKILVRFELLVERLEKVTERLERNVERLSYHDISEDSEIESEDLETSQECDDEIIEEESYIQSWTPDRDLIQAILEDNSKFQWDSSKWRIAQNVAQYGGASWETEITRARAVPLSECMRIADADPRITFFFYNARGNLILSNHDSDHPNKNTQIYDAVFFGGRAWFGSAPQSDAYIKCINGQDAWDLPKTNSNQI